MDLSDLEKLLEPLSEEEPCGPDLEYDAEFGEMERAAQSKSEQQFGDTIVEAEPADWKDVKKRAEGLLERTRDMRVCAYLARAALHLDGINGFRFAIELLRGYVENFWETVHPELDRDDNDDPTYRTNTLITLCDEGTMLRDLRDVPLVSSRAVGRFSLKDWEQAREAADSWESTSGGDDDSESRKVSVASIDAAFTDSPLEEVQTTEEATRMSAEHIEAIEQFVTEQVGVTNAVSLRPLKDILEQMNKVVVAQLERLGVHTGPEEEAAEEAAADGNLAWGAEGGGAVAAGQPQAVAYRPGKISTRKEAIQALDAVCEFYVENEPSSPLPLLIRRAQRLASKSFMEILRDLAPDAVYQAEALSGGNEDIAKAVGSTDYSYAPPEPVQETPPATQSTPAPQSAPPPQKDPNAW